MTNSRAAIWVVGDSTAAAFDDPFYIPRQGWGEQLSRYLRADVFNLAHSGASSKDFTTMPEYHTLLHGDDRTPALGRLAEDNYLLIGFGHNNQKPDEARFTDPHGDHHTPGCFANSLYENYIRPALDAGVTPVLVTPIARLTEENTPESYLGASGHITATTTTAEGHIRPGGDYPQAIRDLAAAVGIHCIDLTPATIEMNIAMGENARWLHAYTTETELDKTHTNAYGAKMHAWLIARLGRELFARYLTGAPMPTYEQDFAASLNPHYCP